MRFEVAVFSWLKDLVGGPILVIDLSPNSTDSVPPTASDVLSAVASLLGQHDAAPADLERRLATCKVAINEEYADSSTPVQTGDDLAIIPPVSGG